MERRTKYHDDLVQATAFSLAGQDGFFREFWNQMKKKDETPDQRLKKLFAEEKISADKYSELFGRCTDADVDKLCVFTSPPKKRTVVDEIDEQIRDTHQCVRYSKDHVLVLGWNKSVELDGSFRGRPYERSATGSYVSYYCGIEIVPPATQDDGNTVSLMRRVDYVRLKDESLRRYDYGTVGKYPYEIDRYQLQMNKNMFGSGYDPTTFLPKVK